MVPLIACMLAVAGVAWGQPVTGAIFGTVRDSSSRALPGADVVVEDATRAVRRVGATGPAGDYRIAGLPPGEYRVTASARNLQPASAAALTLAVDARLRQDFTLHPGPVRESVQVEASARGLETESPAVGTNLDRATIASLPLNRRDFLQLCFLAPGILPPVQDSELSSRGSFAMHAGGAREEYNNFTLDGADNNDPYTNRYVLQPPVESIREFKLLAGAYSAEYGRGAGGQVNVVTRSGSNEWHGAAYEYLRNRVLDARNFFEGAERPKYVRNQFGASLGGPLRRDETFFFANYEGLRERRGLPRLSLVPTAAERAGELSRPAVDPFTRQPFAGNRIPASRIHPLSARVLSLFPAANSGAGSLLSQPTLRDTFHNLLTRFDHRLSSRDDVTVRYAWGKQDLFEPFAEEATDVPGFGNFVDNTGHDIALQHQRVWSPRVFQTTRFSFLRSFRRARQQNHASDINREWGINWLPTSQRDFGYPSIKIAGFAQVGDVDQLPLGRTTDTWQVQPSVALIAGAHSLRFGGEVRRIATDGYLDYFSRGTLTFSGALSGQGISDLLLGLPSFSLQAKFDNRQSLRTTAMHGFAQDDWRLRPSLNLSVGVRYEYNTPPIDPEDRMYTLVPSAGQLKQVGRDGIPRAGIRPDRNNWAPRVGIAWSPSERWTVRSGYGLYYDSGMFVVNSSFYFNPPLFNTRVFFPTATSLLSLADPFPARGGIVPPPSPNTLSPDIVSGYLQHWNATVERQVSRSVVASVAYVGSKGTHLIRSRDLNQPRPGAGAVAARRPNPAFSGVFFAESGANSNFHSLQAKAERRMARGVSLIGAYTWSKSIDDTSAFLGTKPDKNFPQDSANYGLERARSSFDMRQRFSLSAVWAVRGFELRTIAAAQTGQPFTPLLRFDNSNTGNTGSIFGNDRPELLRSPRLDSRGPDRWFDTTAFAVPRPFTFGSAGRNIVDGPGLINVDFGVSRRLAVGERWALIADVQAFNLTNTAHFDMPERYADEPSFGRIFSAKPPRQVQLGLRLAF